MLVLSRKRGDAVAMGERQSSEHVIKVTVLEICGAKVKLGFEAGDHIAVHRWEVWQRIVQENEASQAPAVASKKSTDRWDDDGGHTRSTAAVPRSTPK